MTSEIRKFQTMNKIIIIIFSWAKFFLFPEPLAEGNYKTLNIRLISVNALWVTNYDKALSVFHKRTFGSKKVK